MDPRVDLFSYLADHIILIIISFLPFKEAARTCILSKRWRDLWRCTSNIEFDQSFFARQPMPAEIQRQTLFSFAQQWMLNFQEPEVHGFRLSVSYSSEFRSDIEQWIGLAIRKHVKKLGLELSDQEWMRDDPEDHGATFDLPSDVYQHTILQSLQLSACNIKICNLINFSALRDLSLSWMRVTTACLRSLLRNCPLLESLTLKKCRSLDYVDISVPNLRLTFLSIEHCSPVYDGIRISASNLRSFKYSGSLQIFDIENVSCIEEAELDFGVVEDEFDEFGDHLCKILSFINPIKVLTVCSYMLQVLPSGTEPLGMVPALYGVRHLILKTALHMNELPGVAFMLKTCPFLKILSIEIGAIRNLHGYEPPYRTSQRLFWSASLLFMNCVQRELKVVEIKGFKGHYNEMQLLRYFLRRGRVLERMTIDTSKEIDPNGGDPEIYAQNARSLLEVKRASAFVQVLIT